MRILNQTNVDELIKRIADRELIMSNLEDEDDLEGIDDGGGWGDDMEWNQWIESLGW